MFGNSKKSTAPSTKYVHAPESYLPEHMRDRLKDAEEYRAGLAPFTERGWQNYLEETSMGVWSRAAYFLTRPYLVEENDGEVSVEDARALTQEYLAEPERAWTAYVTLRTQSWLEDLIKTEKAAAENQRRRERVLRCPVCGMFSDVDHIGAVTFRELLSKKSLRSCEACHTVAALLLAQAAASATTSDGSSRASTVAGFMQTEGLAPSLRWGEAIAAMAGDAARAAKGAPGELMAVVNAESSKATRVYLGRDF